MCRLSKWLGVVLQNTDLIAEIIDWVGWQLNRTFYWDPQDPPLQERPHQKLKDSLIPIEICGSSKGHPTLLFCHSTFYDLGETGVLTHSPRIDPHFDFMWQRLDDQHVLAKEISFGLVEPVCYIDISLFKIGSHTLDFQGSANLRIFIDTDQPIQAIHFFLLNSHVIIYNRETNLFIDWVLGEADQTPQWMSSPPVWLNPNLSKCIQTQHGVMIRNETYILAYATGKLQLFNLEGHLIRQTLIPTQSEPKLVQLFLGRKYAYLWMSAILRVFCLPTLTCKFSTPTTANLCVDSNDVIYQVERDPWRLQEFRLASRCREFITSVQGNGNL